MKAENYVELSDVAVGINDRTTFDDPNGEQQASGYEEHEDKENVSVCNNEYSSLLYKIDDVPPFAVMITVAIQNVLLGLGGCLTTAYFISDVICAPTDHPIRAKLFCTTLFMTGFCTSLMPLIGVRLPIYQSVCSTFLVPLMAMRNDDRWNCNLQRERYSDLALTNSTNSTITPLDKGGDELEYEMYIKLREMMGCLLLASLLEVLVGATGLAGKLLRFIGPLPISVVVALIGLSLYKIPMEYAKTHWGLTTLCISLIVLFMLYLDRVQVPIPSFSCRSKQAETNSRLPMFKLFPMLFSIAITWAVCAILTSSGYFSDDPESPDYRARTDVRTNIIHSTPWFYFPYPGQFGSPLFNTTIFVGFLSTVVSSIFETIGDYYATASLSLVPPPPKSAVNRGIFLEGIGSVISGAVGAGHATTSSTGNLSLIGITRVASRSCLVATGVMTMLLSVIGKLGAVISTMPDPAVGGSMFIVFGIMAAIGCFTLRAVDLTSARNLSIFGISLYVGIVIPEWLDRYPKGFDLGNETANGVIKGILGAPMFLGGIVAVFLDNTVKGTARERGMHTRERNFAASQNVEVSGSARTIYDLPYVDVIGKYLPGIHKLPFIQNKVH
ncbi:solute carrier family 23 member 2-like [Mya arenaria]|uniref:solute carrier family 23 member 2-like n=1 Tax=Mya arenaria TaxID=6604 RepID=UPI0022E0C8F7|nr:solute carrier family 23 member 2-like [Mya arenaria]